MILEISSVGVFFIVLGSAAVIGLIAFLLYLYIKPKFIKDDKPSEEDLLEEEMNRLLKPIDDDETAKAVSEYKDEEE